MSNNSLLQKFKNFRAILKQHGGIKGAYLQFLWTDDVKLGKEVGVDQFGNKYFHNPAYMMGKSRWVDYAPQFGYDYDASQVPPDWHRWLHYISDEIPTDKPLMKPEWGAEYTENQTGLSNQYVPYSTTKQKIEAWAPPKKIDTIRLTCVKLCCLSVESVNVLLPYLGYFCETVNAWFNAQS